MKKHFSEEDGSTASRVVTALGAAALALVCSVFLFRMSAYASGKPAPEEDDDFEEEDIPSGK